MELWIGPTERTRARLPGRVSVTFGGSFAGQTWEIKVGIGRSKAGDKDLDAGHRARSALADDGRTGLAPGPSLGYAEHWQATYATRPALGQKAYFDSGSPGRTRISANESRAMGNFWESLNTDQKRAFRAKAHNRVFAAGARLMQEGEEADHVAVILSGLTEIRVCENGAERVVAERGPGQLIGERAALRVSVRSATVVALQTVVALVMRTADFAAFISTYPAVLKMVEEQIYLRLREAPAWSEPDQRHDLSGDQADDWLAPERAGRDDTGAVASRPPLLIGQNCTVVRTDVVAFGADNRTREARRIIRRALPAMTRAALGSVWDSCRCDDRGDGLLIVVSPGIPTAQVIDRLVAGLPRELKRHNRTYRDPIRIELRVAVEVGPIEEDDVGLDGKSIIQVSRMLDAPAFKQAIADRGAVFGLVVSQFVYDTYIGDDGYVDPADYARIPVQVKETRASAWMLLIDAAGAVLRPQEQLMHACGRQGLLAAA